MACTALRQVYTTSLDTLDDTYRTDIGTETFSAHKKELLVDIERVQKNTFARKVNLLDKRSRMVRNHAFFMMKVSRHFAALSQPPGSWRRRRQTVCPCSIEVSLQRTGEGSH